MAQKRQIRNTTPTGKTGKQKNNILQVCHILFEPYRAFIYFNTKPSCRTNGHTLLLKPQKLFTILVGGKGVGIDDLHPTNVQMVAWFAKNVRRRGPLCYKTPELRKPFKGGACCYRCIKVWQWQCQANHPKQTISTSTPTSPKQTISHYMNIFTEFLVRACRVAQIATVRITQMYLPILAPAVKGCFEWRLGDSFFWSFARVLCFFGSREF